MKRYSNFFLLVILLTTSSIFALDANTHKTITQIIQHFTNAWNDREGRGSAEHNLVL